MLENYILILLVGKHELVGIIKWKTHFNQLWLLLDFRAELDLRVTKTIITKLEGIRSTCINTNR